MAAGPTFFFFNAIYITYVFIYCANHIHAESKVIGVPGMAMLFGMNL